MAKDEGKGTIKKTVVIHPIMDSKIRTVWSLLIGGGHNASYSMALNFLLLVAIIEMSKEGGLSEKTMESMQDFLKDREMIDELDLQEHLGQLKKYLGLG